MKNAADEFECDLAPDTGWPRVRFNLDNGWSASVMFRLGRNGFEAQTASVAACPTGEWGTGLTEIGETEASADEVIRYLADVQARPLYVKAG